jgi:hypothetical protein
MKLIQSLPNLWYDAFNLCFLSIQDFKNFCEKKIFGLWALMILEKKHQCIFAKSVRIPCDFYFDKSMIRSVYVGIYR